MDKRIITYGTFDLFHDGHYNLLKRAKELGNFLIVGVTSENYDKARGKLNVRQSLSERIENVRKTGLADMIIVEEYEGQKIEDIQRYNVDIFVIGSDWLGQFDYLKEYCEVIYLPRTRGISSTKLRGIINIGVVGYGRIANRFIPESKFVSGVVVTGVYGPNIEKSKNFMKQYELSFCSTNYEEFLEKVDAVYIASPHTTHYEYTKKALEKNKHVLCEKPLTLSEREARELYDLAKSNSCVFLEAIKTAYIPGFSRLVSIAKSGIIGKIVNVDATFTKLVEGNVRELDPAQKGGSVTELSSYPLLVITKLLGINPKEVIFYSLFDNNRNIDMFTKINIIYNNAIATAKVGLGVKAEGDLIISGTKGYIYVPSPWWKTEYFEVRGDDGTYKKRYFESFEGDGLRYELAEFVNLINNNTNTTSYKLKPEESIFIASIIEMFLNGYNLKKI